MPTFDTTPEQGPWTRYQKQGGYDPALLGRARIRAQEAGDGPWTKYQSAPEAASARQSFTEFADQLPVPATVTPATVGEAIRGGMGEMPDGPSIVGDVVRAGPAGFARGTADLVGTPGFVKAIADGGSFMSRIGRQLVPDAMAPIFDMQDSVLGGVQSVTDYIPSGSDIKAGLSDVTDGATDYQPQTVPGEYARTVGEFAPAAIASTMGGGGLPAFVRGGVIPALGSETAGQLTKDTELEPYARILGALVAGQAGSRVGQPQAAKPPTAAAIKESAGYAALKEPMKAAKVDQPTFNRIVRDVWGEAQDFGLTTDLKKQFGGTLADYARKAQAGGASLYDLELMRRSLRNAAGDKLDDVAQALSAKLIDKLDDAVNALPEATVPALREAREIYRIGMKASTIERAIDKASRAASGVENGLRNEFRKLLNDPKTAKQFSEAERALIDQVGRGTFTSNALRWFGSLGIPVDQGRNFLGSLFGGGIGGTIGSALTGSAVGAGIGAPVVMGLGTAAKLGANKMTRDAAALADAAVKAGPGASEAIRTAAQARAAESAQRLLRALYQGQQAYGAQ